MTEAFGMIEIAAKEVIEALLEDAEGKVGGDLSYDGAAPFYVWVALIPGSGSVGEVYGQWTLDIDVFGQDYATTMRRALALEAILLGIKGHRTSEMIIDLVTGGGPAELPWDDENAFRVGTQYTFTARRSG